MVGLEKIQAYMRSLAAEDAKASYIQAVGESLQAALEQASIELGLPITSISYEVLERGSRGVFGFGRKRWIVVASARRMASAGGQAADAFSLDFGFSEANDEGRDGEAFVRLTPEGVFLKVSAPTSKGRRVSEREAVEAISRRHSGRVDAAMVSRIVRHADGQFIKIADYDYNPAYDAVLSVEILDFEMKAVLTMTPPGPGGGDPSFDTIVTFLRSNGVVHGIKEDVVLDLEQRPQYHAGVVVAEGSRPQNGQDASVVYNFANDKSVVRLKEKNGRVDFKELNLIQNVVEGQVLAKKVPPQRGEAGRTVTGKLLPAKDGRDIEIGAGKNVRLSDDKNTAIAEINGQVVLSGDKINVEPVYVVSGDVNLKTGNILFLGTVLIRGNVDDGFSVKAAGNIEVMGSVGRCDMDAEGDIIVHQGITGRNSGKIISGKSLWSKFIENAHVEAGGLVVVSDGIINSQVFADKKVICKGRRASIVGGHIRASEEINAKSLGSVAGSETICEVGYDPKSKDRQDRLEARRMELYKQLEDINMNLTTLENLRKVKKALPGDKQAFFEELSQKRAAIATEIASIDSEIEGLKIYLSQLKTSGKVSCSGIVFPGVKIVIKEAVLDVRNETKAVTYLSENNLVRVTKYEEPDEDITRKA